MADKPSLAAVEAELKAARRARQEGNEGKARVCARRAAGWSVALRFRQQFGDATTNNAMVLLEWLQRQSAIPAEYRQAAQRLTIRINEDHALPHEKDPIEDAVLIVCGMARPKGAA